MLLLTTYPQSARQGPSSRRAGGTHALVLRAMSCHVVPWCCSFIFSPITLEIFTNKLVMPYIPELIIPSAVKTRQA